LPIIILVFVASLLAAGDVPAWFSERIVDPVRLEGHGVGASVETARLAALADLTDQIAVSIASARNSTLSTKSDDGQTTVHDDFRQVLRSSSAFRDLAGAEVGRREQVGEVWYVAVSIARDALRRQLENRLNELDARLGRGLGERPPRPTAAWVGSLRDLLTASREREALAAAAIAQGLNVSASPLPASAVRLHLGGLADPAILALADPSRSAGMASGLRSAAPDLGSAIADDPAAARWIIELAEERSDATTARGWTKVTLRGTATIRDVRGTAVVGVLAAEGSATSTISADEASRQAAAALGRRTAEVARDQLLLILLRNRFEGSAP
jgi:hypothetical protein